jgi:hypothetical protein
MALSTRTRYFEVIEHQEAEGYVAHCLQCQQTFLPTSSHQAAVSLGDQHIVSSHLDTMLASIDGMDID